LKAFGALRDKIVIDQSLFDNHMRHRREDWHVRPDLERKPHLGEVHQVNAARVNDDHLRAVFLHRFLHLQRNDGMILGRVRPRDDEHVILNHLRCRVAHRRRTNRLLKRDHRTCVTQARAVVNIVRAEQRAENFLQQIIIFVRGFGTAIDRHRIRAITFVDFHEFIGGDIEGSIPIGGDPIPVVGDLNG
jgi:hypothetical protein